MGKTKVEKWGNSMALRIPARTMKAWGVEEGQAVVLAIKAGVLVATPTQRRYTLAELVAQCDFSQPMTSDDQAWDSTPPVGLEVI